MSSEFKILTLVGWDIQKVGEDDKSKHPANLLLPNQRYWFFKYWPDSEFEVDVMGLDKHILMERRFLRFYLRTPLKALSKSSGYDLILCFHSQLGLPLAFLMQKFDIKTPLVIFDVEGFGRKNNFWQRKFIRQALSRVSLVFYLAKVQKEDYARYYPEVLDRSEFLPFGVDLSRFPYQEKRTEDYILSIGYQGSEFRDWKTLLEAFSLFKTKTKLVIVGKSGFRRDEVGHSTLENVEFVRKCNLPELNEYVSRCKFVVLPFAERRQALGQMTLLGVMALGKAVVVSQVCGIKDYLTHGQDGLFYQPGNPYDLAEKICHLLSNPRRTERLGRKAKETVEKKFNEKRMAQKILETLKKRHLIEGLTSPPVRRMPAIIESKALSEEMVS